MKSQNRRETEQVELVETYNLARSFVRLGSVYPFSALPCKRALYHALAMSSQLDTDVIRQIREVLKLP